MGDITPGKTFVSGEQNVDHSDLNNLGSGTINTTFYSGKSGAGANPNTAFEVLLRDTVLDTYKKTTLAAILDHTSLLSTRTAKTVPVAADAVLLADSAAGNALKQMTVANLLFGAAAFAGAIAADDKLTFSDTSGGTVHSLTVQALIGLLAANTNPLPSAAELMLREGSGTVTRCTLANLIAQATNLAVPVGTFSIPIYDGAYKRITLDNLIAGLANSLTTPIGTELVQVYDVSGGGTIKKATLSDLRKYLLQSNVQQAQVTNGFVLNPAGAWTDVTGLSVAITPRSTASKVLVRASIAVDIDTNNAHFKLVRAAADIGLGDSDSSNRTECGRSAIASADYNDITFEWLDSPATAGAVTYKVQVLQSSGAVNINRTSADTDNANTPRPSSTLTVMEVYQ